MAPNGEPAPESILDAVASPMAAAVLDGPPPNGNVSERTGDQKPARKAAAKKATAARNRAPARRAAPAKKAVKKPAKKASTGTPGAGGKTGSGAAPKYPRHSVKRALRIPRAILDENAGHPCTVAEAWKLLDGSGDRPSGPFVVEISSAKKYGFLEALPNGRIGVTDRAKRALRPQSDIEEPAAIREAVLAAPDISAVYNHYRGENLPDEKYYSHALVDTFAIPEDKLSEFREIFMESMRAADLVDESSGRIRLIDLGRGDGAGEAKPPLVSASRGAAAKVSTDGSCFVMQPFAAPYGGYYELLFKPAIEAAGLRPVRADDEEIFGAGKIMDQVWRGIGAARVLVAELTSRNPNVFYELGLAHAQGKPVVLVASQQEDIPFDLNHIRVIYYDMTDPFWGKKLMDKITENLKSALANPEEAIFRVSENA